MAVRHGCDDRKLLRITSGSEGNGAALVNGALFVGRNGARSYASRAPTCARNGRRPYRRRQRVSGNAADRAREGKLIERSTSEGLAKTTGPAERPGVRCSPSRVRDAPSLPSAGPLQHGPVCAPPRRVAPERRLRDRAGQLRADGSPRHAHAPRANAPVPR